MERLTSFLWPCEEVPAFYSRMGYLRNMNSVKRILGQMVDKERESLNTTCHYYMNLIIATLTFRVCDARNHAWFFGTSWTVTCQAPLSMEFSRQEYWSWLPFPSPGDLPDSGIELVSLASPAVAGGFFTSWAIREAPGSFIFLLEHFINGWSVFTPHWVIF